MQADVTLVYLPWDEACIQPENYPTLINVITSGTQHAFPGTDENSREHQHGYVCISRDALGVLVKHNGADLELIDANL